MGTITDATSTLYPSTPLSAGTPAPEFRLASTPDQFVSLQDFRNAPVILAFYPADWSPVCGDQMALYCSLCDRLGGDDPLELPIPHRRESRRGRNPCRSRGAHTPIGAMI